VARFCGPIICDPIGTQSFQKYYNTITSISISSHILVQLDTTLLRLTQIMLVELSSNCSIQNLSLSSLLTRTNSTKVVHNSVAFFEDPVRCDHYSEKLKKKFILEIQS